MSINALIRAGLPLPGGAPGSASYASWLASVTQMLPRVHVAPFNPSTAATAPANWYSSTEDNISWAGYEDYQNTYGLVQGQWDMANVSTPLTALWGIGQWVGIGGDTANTSSGFASLMQSGGEIYNQGSGSTTTLFVEAVSGYNSENAAQCGDYTAGSANPGNNLWGEDGYVGPVVVDNTTYSQFRGIANNVTTGGSTGWVYFDCPTNYVDNSAEAILETPYLGNGAYYNLPPFSDTADYWNYYTYTSSGEVNGEVAPYRLINLDVINGSQATPTNWTSETSFGINWQHSP